MQHACTLTRTHTHTHTHTHARTHTHTHTDENPAIVIPSSDLQAQASALGSPVDTLINDPAFIGTAPEGVTGTGAALGLTVTVSILLVSVAAALVVN